MPRLKGPWNTKALLRLAAAPVLSSVAIALLGAAIGAEPGTTLPASSQEKPAAVPSSVTTAGGARIGTPQHKTPVLSRRGVVPRTVQSSDSRPAAGNQADRLGDDVAAAEPVLEEKLPPPDVAPSMIFVKNNGEEKSSAHFFDRFAKPIRQFGPKPFEDVTNEDAPLTEEEVATKDDSSGEVPAEKFVAEEMPQDALPAAERVVEKSEAAVTPISDEAIEPIPSQHPALTVRGVQPQEDAVAEHLPAQSWLEPQLEPMDEADDVGFAEAPAKSQLSQPVLQRAPSTPWASLPPDDTLAESPRTSKPLVLPSETLPESPPRDEMAAVLSEAKGEESASSEPAPEPDRLARRAGVSPSMLFQPKRQRNEAAHFFGKNAATEKVFHASKPVQPGMSDLARKHLEGLRSTSAASLPNLAKNQPTASSTANKPQPLQGAALAGTKAGPTAVPGHTALVSKQAAGAPQTTSPAITAANPATTSTPASPPAAPSTSTASVATLAADKAAIPTTQPMPSESPSAAPATGATTSLANNDASPTPASVPGPQANMVSPATPSAAAVASSDAAQSSGTSPAASAARAAASPAAPQPNTVASQPAPQPPAVLPWAPLPAEKPVVPNAVPPAPSNPAPPVVVVVQAPGNNNAPLPVAPGGAQTPVYVVVQQSGQAPGAKAAPKPAAPLADAQLAQPASAQASPRAKPAAVGQATQASQPTASNASQIAQTAALTKRLQPPETMPPTDSNSKPPSGGQQSGDSNSPPQIGEAPRPRNLEFLRRENILLEPGEYEIDITLQYSNDNEDFFFAQIQNSVLQIGEAERVQRLLLAPLELRYGFSPVTQGFVNVPFGWSNSEVAFLGQDEYANTFGIGDVSAGLVHQCIEGNQYCPDVLTTVAFSVPTGEASLVNALTVPGSSLGQGFFTATLGFTFIQQYDPVVLFYGFGYQHRFHNEIDGIDVDPGAVYFYRLGLGFAINSRVTVSATFLGSYIERDEINGAPLGGSIREPMQLRLATTIGQGNRKECKSRWKTIEPFVNFGLTDDAIDSVFGISWTR